MAYVPSGLVNQAKLDAAVQKAAAALSADVVRIQYELGSDWIENPSIFFKIVLKDNASTPGKLRAVSQRVALKLMNEAKTDEAGLYAYFSFRSASEHAKLKDPAWA